MNCTTQIFRLSHRHKDPQAVQWNVASCCFHGCDLQRKTAKDLFKDTCDAHLMGPQGLSTWRIGIKAGFFWIQKVQQTSHLFPWKTWHIPQKLMVVWKMKCPFYKWSLKIRGHVNFRGSSSVWNVSNMCVWFRFGCLGNFRKFAPAQNHQCSSNEQICLNDAGCLREMTLLETVKTSC